MAASNISDVPPRPRTGTSAAAEAAPVSKLNLLLSGSRSSTSSLVPIPVATPVRSVLGILGASRRLHESGCNHPSSSSGAISPSLSIVAYTPESKQSMGGLSALFRRLDAMPFAQRSFRGKENLQAQPSLNGLEKTRGCRRFRRAAPLVDPPSNMNLHCQQKRAAADSVAPVQEFSRSSCSGPPHSRQNKKVRTTRSAEEPEAEQAIVAASFTNTVHSRGSGKRVTARAKRKSTVQLARRQREDLQAQSFGVEQDFLGGGALVAVTATESVNEDTASSPKVQRSQLGMQDTVVMSPSSLAFLDSLHTGLTPTKNSDAEGLEEEPKRLKRLPKSRKTEMRQTSLIPVGLEAFLCDAKARRGQLPLPIEDAQPDCPTRRRMSGSEAVGELRRALRTIDDTAPPSWVRQTQVVDGDEEAESEAEDIAPIADIDCELF